jgi:hypothetical protein
MNMPAAITSHARLSMAATPRGIDDDHEFIEDCRAVLA